MKRAALRVCASCEWIFTGGVECPMCQFGSYGARYVYGGAAYRYARTQQPWRERKLADYAVKLDVTIRTARDKQKNAVPTFTTGQTAQRRKACTRR